MARTARSVHARKKRRKVLEQAKGYRGTKHSSYKRAKEQVWKSGVYAYEGRKQRKRDFRALWIQRINAGAREHGLSYSRLVHGLRLAEVDLDASRHWAAEGGLSFPPFADARGCMLRLLIRRPPMPAISTSLGNGSTGAST